MKEKSNENGGIVIIIYPYEEKTKDHFFLKKCILAVILIYRWEI